MATYAEGKFKVEKYEFNVSVAEGGCPKNVYVRIRGDNGYSDTESFAKREIEGKSTTELAPKIKYVAHTAAGYAHSSYWSVAENDPKFDENFVKGLEPILAEGIDNFNGGKTVGNLQKIIAALKGK